MMNWIIIFIIIKYYYRHHRHYHRHPSHQGLNSFINRFAKNAPVFSTYPTKQTINALSANINSSSSSNTCWYRKSNSFFFCWLRSISSSVCSMEWMNWMNLVCFVFSKFFFCSPWISSKMTFFFCLSWMMNVSCQFHF